MNAVLILAAAFLGGGSASQSTATSAAQKTAAAEPVLSAPRLFPFREDGKDGKWGYMDVTGKVVIKPKYPWRVEPFREGLAAVAMDGRWGYIDEEDRLVFRLPQGCDPFPGAFSDGMAYFRQNVKYGFYDRDGKLVVPAKYDRVSSFSGGLAAVSLEQRTPPVVVAKYQSVGISSQGLAAVSPGEETGVLPVRRRFVGKWGYIDKTGREVIPLQFDEAKDFSEALALVKTADGYAYIDTKGKIAFTLNHLTFDDRRWRASWGSSFSGGLAWVRVYTDGTPAFRTAFIDKTGKLAFSMVSLQAGDYSEGLAPVRDAQRKWSYMDTRGRTVIPRRFDLALPFREGLAAVQIGSGELLEEAWGYINRQGAWVVDPQRHEGLPGPINQAGSFSGGLARVHIGGTRAKVYDGPGYWRGSAWYYINRQGQIVRRERNDDDVR